jgi:hypothetical protein
MAVSNEDLLKQQLIASVQQVLVQQQQTVGADHCLLIRFYSDLTTVNSKAHQAGIAVSARPSQDVLAARAALHMFAGDTEGSYFISFSEDIVALVNATDGIDMSWGVKSIIMGSKPEFFGKKGMENISWAPAQHIGIFKVNKTDIIKWSDQALKQEVRLLCQKNPRYLDLKQNFAAEHEVVAYYPGPIEAPVATVDNPFYPVYMSKV